MKIQTLSYHSRTNPGSPKEPSMTCYDKKVNLISASLFPLMWNGLQEALGNTPPPSQGRGSLVGCRLWGHTESEATEAT